MSFFRDWYAGRKFAEYVKKTGEAARMIAAHETKLGFSFLEPDHAVATRVDAARASPSEKGSDPFSAPTLRRVQRLAR
jgi:hypothetical protein